MIKRISTEDLKPGMFVSSFDLSWFKHPFVSTRLGVVRDQGLINELKKLGISHVEIDTDLCTADEARPSPEIRPGKAARERLQPCPSEGDPERSARFARKLFDHAMTATRSLMDSVRAGKPVRTEEFQPLVARLVDAVNHNENVLHIILSLKSFDDYTYTHSLNLAALGVLLGKSMNLEQADLERLGLAGILHDVGKCLVPREVIVKPGPLTEEEFNLVKAHPALAHGYLSRQNDIPGEVLRAVLEHHERLDGSGYPRGLADGAIHPYSSIISVVDVYDALTSDRVYRPRMSPHAALRLLFNQRGQTFPEAMVDTFIKRLGVYPSFSVVQLRNGCYAVVTRQTPGRPLFPEVMVFCDREHRPLVKRRLDTWRLCGELARKEYEIERPVEPGELPPPMLMGIA
ncbi:HD-GYP domain-containing protein [Fundidesulfovibrio terrae]|uniref:HD-GYP domain-containing protein n=1 Tax=Fundidesulfovibrio terrae TaxID=2922866 RepID=UPI001FAEAD39|nr:HD-GYP domain-containing protein [Fundidesulfovibrio terrae]